MESGYALPEAAALYEQLKGSVGTSALHFGVCRQAARAVVLVNKTKVRNLALPRLNGAAFT
eukprot:10195253-Alexandrium_andersonii.AAC.1